MADFDFREEEESRPRRQGYGRSDTSRILYVILALLFGATGLHNFAAGRYAHGGVQLVGFLVSLPLCLVFGLGLFGIGFLILWSLLDIVTVTRDGRGRQFSGS